MKLTPILFFVYNRLEHTKRTIAALQNNELSKESELFIYSDGAKDEAGKEIVNELRKYLKTIDGFKQVVIIERDTNWGLANSIIDGVTSLVSKFKKVIVLEDDIVTSPYFLKFMNDALSFYENEPKVWHISGWNYPIDTLGLNETFLWRTMNCWGWATWSNRWEHYEKNPKKLIELFDKEDINRFNLDGETNFWEQVLKNNLNQMNTWAIFWYAIIFKNNGLCINPSQSLVENIGFDGTGTNTGCRDNYTNKLYDKQIIKFELDIYENKIAVDKIKLFFREKNNSIYVDFSNNLNKLYKKLDILEQSNEKYIIYGAGTIGLLIGTYMCELIECFVDIDINKNGQLIAKKLIIVPSKELFEQHNDLKIVVSTIGRFDLISKYLNDSFQVPKERIISLDILD